MSTSNQVYYLEVVTRIITYFLFMFRRISDNLNGLIYARIQKIITAFETSGRFSRAEFTNLKKSKNNDKY